MSNSCRQLYKVNFKNDLLKIKFFRLFRVHKYESFWHYVSWIKRWLCLTRQVVIYNACSVFPTLWFSLLLYVLSAKLQ